jgi:predicted house-cleaning NTP pyrophosphatase (Maf/HAM1 superfamily)
MEKLKEELRFCFDQADMWVDFFRVTGITFEEATGEDVRRYVEQLERETKAGPDIRAE